MVKTMLRADAFGALLELALGPILRTNAERATAALGEFRQAPRALARRRRSD